MAILRSLKSGDFKDVLKVAILRSLKSGILRSLKSGDFKES